MEVKIGPLVATIRECWINPKNKRESCRSKVEDFTIHAIVIESVDVIKSEQNKGHFKRFLQTFLDDDRFDMVVVEGVGNPILAEFLKRNGWEYDEGVMDFYKEIKNGN